MENPYTFQFIAMTVAGIVALLNALILYYLKVNRDERIRDREERERDRSIQNESRERLIRIETRLEGLDAMRSDIQSNRHKISELKEHHTILSGRVDSISRLCGRCQHGEQL